MCDVNQFANPNGIINHLLRETCEESTTFLKTACRAVRARPVLVATDVDRVEWSASSSVSSDSMSTSMSEYIVLVRRTIVR